MEVWFSVVDFCVKGLKEELVSLVAEDEELFSVTFTLELILGLRLVEFITFLSEFETISLTAVWLDISFWFDWEDTKVK